MQVNLFHAIQTPHKIVYTSVFVTLTTFVDNVLSFNYLSSRTLRRPYTKATIGNMLLATFFSNVASHY
jgi:hypothetical protein